MIRALRSGWQKAWRCGTAHRLRPAMCRPVRKTYDVRAPNKRRAGSAVGTARAQIAAIAIDLQDVGKIAEMDLGALRRFGEAQDRLAIGGIDIGDHRRIAAAPWSVIAGPSPQFGATAGRSWSGPAPDRAPARSSRRRTVARIAAAVRGYGREATAGTRPRAHAAIVEQRRGRERDLLVARAGHGQRLATAQGCSDVYANVKFAQVRVKGSFPFAALATQCL